MLENMYLGYRKFKDKLVPYKLTVATKEIKMLGHTHSTDHWLIWSDFVQIYEVLDELIAEDNSKHKYVSTRPDPKWQRSIVREVPRTNIKLTVTVEKRETELLKLLKIEERHAYKMQFVLKVTDNLSTFSASNGLALNDAVVAIENSPDVTASGDVYTPESTDSSPSYKPRAKTNETRRKDMQEYVPKSSSASSAPQSPYIPSKINLPSSTASDSTLDDQYSPKPVGEAIIVESSQNSESDDGASGSTTKYTPTPRKSTRKITRKTIGEELDENGLLDIRGTRSKTTGADAGPTRKRLHRAATAELVENDVPPFEAIFTTPTSKKTRIVVSQSSSSEEKLTKINSHSSTKSVNLFGSDDSEDELPKKPEAPKNLYEKYKVTDSDDSEAAPKAGGSKPSKQKEKENTENEQMSNSICNWLGKHKEEEVVAVPKKASASTSGKAASKSTKDKLPKMFKHPKPKKAELAAIKKIQEEKERLVKARLELEDINAGFNATQEPIELLTLKMMGEQIIDTFDDLEPTLTNLLEEYKHVNNFKKVKIFGNLTPADIIAHCTVDQAYEMIKFLNQKYNEPENAGLYETLFTELILPEWVIRAFMNMHSMVRDEALSYMCRQRNLLCNEELDLTMGF